MEEPSWPLWWPCSHRILQFTSLMTAGARTAWRACCAKGGKHPCHRNIFIWKAGALAAVASLSPQSATIALQAYSQQHLAPCTNRELHLQSVPPLQIGVVDGYVVLTGPKSSLERGSHLEFQVSASSDNYLNLSQCCLLPELLGPEGWWKGYQEHATQRRRGSKQQGHGGAFEPALPLPVQTSGPPEEQRPDGD